MEAIKIIVSAFSTIFASALGAWLTIWYWKQNDKRKSRVVPIVSILDNKMDEIEARLKMSGNWFVDMEKLEKYSKGRYIFFSIMLHQDFCITNCMVTTHSSNKTNEKARNSYDAPINIGTILPKLHFIYPVEVNGEGLQWVIFQLDYKTSSGEQMCYQLKVLKSENGNFERAEEKSILINGKRFMELVPNNFRDRKSYSSKQVGEKLDAIKGSFNYRKKENENGDNIRSNKSY